MILEFRAGCSRPAVREANDEEGAASSAQIIIFPGVRRERHVETQAPKPRRREKGRTKRDRLEIPD
jgi:hypothetical protein